MQSFKLAIGIALSFALLFAAQLSFAQLTSTGAGKKVSGSVACTFPSTSGLIGRYRADTGVTTSSGNTTAVVNQANPGTSDLTNTGTVPFNATSAYNSKPAFDFVAANTALLKATSFPIGTGVKATVFIVGQMSTSTASFGGAVVYGVTGNDYNTAGNYAFIVRTGSSAGIESDGPTSGGLGGAMSTGANHRFGLIANGGVSKDIYVDNVNVGSQSFSTDTFIDNGTLVIGNRFSSGAPGGGAWEGPVLEVDVWTTALNSTDRDTLNTYYTCQYGTFILPSDLPANDNLREIWFREAA